MEHSYKKTAAAVIALALIAAVILGIALAGSASPTVLPSEEGGASLAKVDSQIASDVNIGAVDQELNPDGDADAVRIKWNMPGATVKKIDTPDKLKSFLGSGKSNGTSGQNAIGVLTADITLEVDGRDDVGTSTFYGVLDGNGHKITLSANSSQSIGEISNPVLLNTDNDGIRDNLQGEYTGTGLNGILSAGLLVGANRGTIANIVIDYSSNMEMPNTLNGNISNADNTLRSTTSPAYMSTFGIVTGANFGTIDNVRVNVGGNFVGRQQESHVNTPDAGGVLYTNRDARSWENTVIVGTLAGILVGGKISDTHVDIASNATVGASADGWARRGTYSAWRNAVAISGGMVGFFIGSNGMLQDSYLSGSGNVRALVCRGEKQGQGKGYNAFSGGITGGKFKISDGLRDSGDMITSAGSGVGDINSQIQGIVVSWRGMKQDNNNSDDHDYVDDFPAIYRNEPGTLIDTANHQSKLAVALTYDYDTLFDGLEGDFAKKGISNTGSVKDWVEVYSSGGDASNRVEVSVADGNFRIQAITADYAASQGYASQTPIEDLPDSTRYLEVASDYTGEYIWQLRQVKPTDAATAQETVIQDYTRNIGAMVYMLSYSGTQAGFEITFGTMAGYAVDYQESNRSRTAMMYDGAPVNEPILSLTAAGETVTANEEAYDWVYMTGSTEVAHEDTMYPGTYTFRPRYQVADSDGRVTAEYAYLDEANRVIVRTSQGTPYTFNVLPATFNVTSTAANGAWTQSATFRGSLATDSYAVYGQTAPSGNIFDAYTYLANNSISDYKTDMSGTSFSFSDEETTAAAGRVYTGFTVYKRNSAGEYVAVGTSRASLTVRIDNAAPILTDTRYYTYSGADEITAENIAQHYFNIKKGAPEYTDVTAQIGDGGWTSDELLVVITASDERRSGVNTIGGAGIQIELQTSGGTSLSRLSIQAQINYGSEAEGGDLSLGSGNAAAIGYIDNSYTLKALLIDTLGNSNNSSDALGTLFVDTTELKLNSVSTPDYAYGRGGSKSALTIDFGENGIQAGPSGAEIMYLVVDKEDIDGSSTEIPAGYEDAWVSLGDYKSGTYRYTIYESFAEGAAIFVKLVSKEGLYPDCVARLYAASGKESESIDGKFPYYYVDLVTTSLFIPDSAIMVDGVSLAELSDLAAAFSKQYDGNGELLASTDPDGASVEEGTGRIIKKIYIDWDAAIGFDGSDTLIDAKAAVQANGYSVVGTYSQYEGVGESELTWTFEVGNNAGTGYKYELLFGTDANSYYTREKTVSTYIDYRDYDIGVEGLVKYDSGFADYLVTEGEEPTNEISVPYWGTNAMPLPETFGYPTGFDDEIYFRYAYVGGTDGVFNAGGNYVVAVDAVQIVTEGTEPTEDGWQSFALGADGSGTLEKYDNYNFRFSTQMKLTVAPRGVNITTSQARIEDDGQGGTVLVPESLASKIAYDGMTHVVMATYRDVYGETVNAVVKVWANPEYTLEAANGISAVGTYYITIAPADEVNYYISNNDKQVFEVVSTTIDIDTAAQTYAYNNGKEIRFELKDGDGVSLDGVKPAQDTVNVVYYNTAGMQVDAPVEIGEYIVQIEYVAGEGSMFSTARFASVLTVTKATPEILGMSDNALTYDRGWHTYSDPDDPNDPVRLVSRNLYPDEDGEYYEFGDVGSQLVLEYLNGEGEWEAVDTLDPNGAGNFVNAGTYTYRYHFVGDSHYEEVWSDPVTLTINKAVYEPDGDFKLYKDDTNQEITTVMGDNGLPVYEADYNGKNQYLTAKSAIVDYELEQGVNATITYQMGIFFPTTNPGALAMQTAQNYDVTITIEFDNYETFTYEMNYTIRAIDIPEGAIVVTTSSGSDITVGTSPEEPQSLTATYDGKQHGYLADGSGEIRIAYDPSLFLDEKDEDDLSITYYPDGSQANTIVNAGSYSGYYLITVDLLNYKPIRVYVAMTVNPKNTEATIEKSDTITDITSETNINNVVTGVFTDVDGNEREGTLVFKNAAGETVTPDDQGRLPAGTYTVTVVDRNGNYLLSGSNSSAQLTVAEPDASHVHTDVDGDGVCDSCGKDVPGIHVHSDANGDGICDGCKAQLGGEQPQPHDHVDANGDGKCDVCGVEMNNQGGNDPVIDPNEGGNTSTIVGGVLIGAAALIVAGTVVGVILIVRKKRKNVI